MSYEKKIKELMDRLLAMSPEPPPYPEEMTTARPGAQKGRRPALVFATAAALVAILAIPLLLFTGGGEPIGADSTTTTSTVTTFPATSTTLDPATTTTTEPGVTTTEPVEGTTWTGVVFVHQSPENSFGGGNPALVPLNVEVSAPPGTFSDHTDFTQILGRLVDSGVALPEPFENAIPSDVRLVWWGEEEGVVRPDMNESFRAGAGGLLADMTMLNQLVYNLTWMNEGASVLFTVDDQPVPAFGSEGLDLTNPVDRDDFLDHLHVINLTSPVVPQDDGSYLIEGIANVFEATVTIAVIDGAGDVVDEQFVNATCGSGCWGDFSASIASDLVVPGESSIRVFQYSAEDGSVVDAITIPIPVDGVWRFSIDD
jgi:hypothetical protein